jgi:hypothetical protein
MQGWHNVPGAMRHTRHKLTACIILLQLLSPAAWWSATVSPAVAAAPEYVAEAIAYGTGGPPAVLPKSATTAAGAPDWTPGAAGPHAVPVPLVPPTPGATLADSRAPAIAALAAPPPLTLLALRCCLTL